MMIIRRPLLAAIAFAIASTAGVAAAAPSQHTTDPFVAGSAAAAAGEHATAAAAFERALAARGWSAGTLLNLGNAYAGAGQLGRAILAYERARLLAPRDPAITANLEHVRQLAGVPAPLPSRTERVIASVVDRLSADEWTWIAVSGGGVLCLGLLGLAWRSRRGLARTAVVAGAGVAVLAGAAAVHVAPPSDRAVVVAAGPARIAPFDAAEPAFTAADGETVEIAQRRGDFVYVRDGDRTGWLPRAAVEPVVSGGGSPAPSPPGAAI